MKPFSLSPEALLPLLSDFAFTNEEALDAPPKGLLIEFAGLGDLHDMARRPTMELKRLARAGLLCAEPFSDPWGWCNDGVVALADALVDAFYLKYPSLRGGALISSGGSMGGMSALTYLCKTRHAPTACCALYPVCDMLYHYDERGDLPRTLRAAYQADDLPFEAALRAHSPLHLLERMPQIPYLIIQGEADSSVHREIHAERFVPAMRAAGHDVRYISVPDMGHEPVSHFPEIAAMRVEFLLAQLRQEA